MGKSDILKCSWNNWYNLRHFFLRINLEIIFRLFINTSFSIENHDEAIDKVFRDLSVRVSDCWHIP